MRFPTYLRVPLALGILLFGAASCSDDDDAQPASNPQTVSFTQSALYPEGVQYDGAQSRYFVSSLRRGIIGQVKDDGTYTQFADDPRLVSTIGLNLDAGRNRLLAAVSDPGAGTRTSMNTAGTLAALAIFDVPASGTTGTLSRFINLGSLRPGQGHFANDMAVDAQGNVYVTDSFSPIIYKVDAAGTATVFYENAALATATGEFGFNGIVFHPDGFLLVAHSTLGRLYKITIPTTGTAQPLAQPVVSAQALGGADGLLLQNNQTLLVVSNSQQRVFRLNSTDAWANAQTTSSFTTGDTFPTTLTRRGDSDVYVLYAYLSKLFGGVTPAQETFSINKVTF